MLQYRLHTEIQRVGARHRHLRFWQGLAVAWLIAALVAAGAWGLQLGLDRPMTLVLFAIAGLLAAVAVWMAASFARDDLWVAHGIEAKFPELRSCLLAAIEQRPDLPDGRFGYLQSSVIRQALHHAAEHPWQQSVPGRRIALAIVANFATFSLFLFLALGLSTTATSPDEAARRAMAAAAIGKFTVAVEPGDAEVESGTSLLVLARVTGEPPVEATLVFQRSGEETRLLLSRSLEDPVFGGRIPEVKEPLEYRVELGSHVTPTYRVQVFEYPRLERADARLVYPGYTGMEERLVQDVRTISVVEGTEATLICYLNKPVATATLVEDKFEPIELSAVAGDKPAYQATIRCMKSRRLKLQLVDERGRKNVQTDQISINVLPNQPPTLKPVFPARDLEVSALEELDVKANVWDDFGLSRYGIMFSLAGQPPVDVVLGQNVAAKSRQDLAHQIRLEDLQAQPDQLLSYHVWAEDHDAAGKVRRTESDMYFAEVRHFEEIYRQGEQPPGGQQPQQRQQQQHGGAGQNAQQAQQLAQLQKDIINATWNLLRRETGSTLNAAFASDVEQISQSQSTALEQATALSQQVQDPESQEHVAAVLQAMQKAIDELTAAHDGPSRDALQPALAAEQAAYQALLKLRAREHRVVRQQQQQQSGQQQNSGSRSEQQRQQMQQLDLAQEENRYETQRTVQSPEESQQAREDRQVLNRLRELARRQHDLNERLKELQSALEEARSEEQREEIRRQLQRLQDEQRQILQDTDELQSRMDQPENQERMSESRQQLEQTRDEVRRSAEALEQQRVSQAAASGTRAEREFEELKEEFRRRASNRFNEEMREMREAAREIDQKERDLAERMARDGKPTDQPRSLRDGNEREEIAQEMTQQRTRLSTLQERMKQTIQDAEQTEPLLSERLYDAARSAQQQPPERSLESAERSLRQGLIDDARQEEQAAGRGIRQLREGIEKAAEAVLGDETEALRRAREELRNLSEELNQEIARNSPQNAPRNSEDPVDRQQAREGNSQSGERQPREAPAEAGTTNGERQPGERQPGEPQPGERQPGTRQRGNRQPGERQPGEPQAGEQQPGERQPGDRQPGERQPGARQPGNRQPGDRQPSEAPAEAGTTNGERQPGEPGPGEQQPGDQQSGEGQPGQRQPGDPQPGNRRAARRLGDPSNPQRAGPGEGFGEELTEFAPLTGENFREWSDRLRDVEEMVDDPQLRAEAARIRERARAIRGEAKRHSAMPQWDLVRSELAEPLIELRDRVAEELLRRTSKQALVPLDRDPVPPRYSEKTRKYYERMGSGK